MNKENQEEEAAAARARVGTRQPDLIRYSKHAAIGTSFASFLLSIQNMRTTILNLCVGMLLLELPEHTNHSHTHTRTNH